MLDDGSTLACIIAISRRQADIGQYSQLNGTTTSRPLELRCLKSMTEGHNDVNAAQHYGLEIDI
jgi:hypothetical protein